MMLISSKLNRFGVFEVFRGFHFGVKQKCAAQREYNQDKAEEETKHGVISPIQQVGRLDVFQPARQAAVVEHAVEQPKGH